jgi:hypothetical protein
MRFSRSGYSPAWRYLDHLYDFALRRLAAEEELHGRVEPDAEELRRQEAHIAWQEEQRHIQEQLDWLCEQHEYEELACYEDSNFIEDYAGKHRQDLLTHRDAILDEYETFHRTHPEAVQRFRTERPDLYLRVWAVFRWRALAAAVRLFVDEPPPVEEPPAPPPETPKETPEELRTRLEAEARAEEELRHFREDLRDEELFRNLDRLGIKKQRLHELRTQYPNLEVEISHLERQFSRATTPRQLPASREEQPRDTSTRPRERY